MPRARTLKFPSDTALGPHPFHTVPPWPHMPALRANALGVKASRKTPASTAANGARECIKKLHLAHFVFASLKSKSVLDNQRAAKNVIPVFEEVIKKPIDRARNRIPSIVVTVDSKRSLIWEGGWN